MYVEEERSHEQQVDGRVGWLHVSESIGEAVGWSFQDVADKVPWPGDKTRQT